jgi:hypothetical protein
VTIDPRFCGPPTSGHGGYTSGRLAAELTTDGPVEVRMMRPIPLGEELPVAPSDDGSDDVIELRDASGDVLATARRHSIDVTPLPAVSLDAAAAAEDRFIWRHQHPFPTCFACGTDRAPGDAWRIFGGVTDDGAAVASAAVCPPDLVEGGRVPPVQVWAALDCITAAALSVRGAPLQPPWLLGTYAVEVLDEVPAGDLVVMAWPLALDGRKFRAAGALYADGRAVAVATATWIQLRE